MPFDLCVADPIRPVPGLWVLLHRRSSLWGWLTATLLLLLPAGLSAQERVAGACPDGTEPTELRGTPACLQEVTFGSGDLTLAGQWFTPQGEGPFPAAVVIRGSGDSQRGNAWTESLARVLVDEGMGVLLPDKRGSGASEGDWRTADFQDLAEDALAGVRFLADRPEVIPETIGVMGLSQGGQVAPIAAARSDSVAFVINVVGAAVPFIENVRYEMLQTFREEGLSGARLEAAMEMVDTAVGYLRGEVSWEEYEAALEEKRVVLGQAIADAYFISIPDHWRWDFFRRMADFDPLDGWREVRQPTLVLLGGADRNTPTAETARRLEEAFEASGHPDATVRTFEGLGHALWDTSGPMSQHGLDAEVRRVLASWVRRATVEGGPEVWEIVTAAREYGEDREGLREHFGWLEEEALEAALNYYERFPERVDAPLVEALFRRGESFPGVLFLSPALRQSDLGHVRALRRWCEAAWEGNPVENGADWIGAA